MPARAVIFLVAFLVLFSCCSPSGESRIKKLLEDRTEALAKGDTEAYLSCFSEDYYDKFFPFDKSAKVIESLLADPGRPAVSFSEPSVYRAGDRALVKEKFLLEGRIAGKARRYDSIQHLRLEKQEDDEWRIVSGSEVYRLLSGRVENEDKIIEALEKREHALENKDIQEYMDVVSRNYEHAGRDAEGLRRSLLENFRVSEDIRYESSERNIWYFGNYATVEQRYKLEYRLMGKPQVAKGVERLELVPESEGWKIIKGL